MIKVGQIYKHKVGFNGFITSRIPCPEVIKINHDFNELGRNRERWQVNELVTEEGHKKWCLFPVLLNDGEIEQLFELVEDAKVIEEKTYEANRLSKVME